MSNIDFAKAYAAFKVSRKDWYTGFRNFCEKEVLPRQKGEMPLDDTFLKILLFDQSNPVAHSGMAFFSKNAFEMCCKDQGFVQALRIFMEATNTASTGLELEFLKLQNQFEKVMANYNLHSPKKLNPPILRLNRLAAACTRIVPAWPSANHVRRSLLYLQAHGKCKGISPSGDWKRYWFRKSAALLAEIRMELSQFASEDGFEYRTSQFAGMFNDEESLNIVGLTN